MKKLLYVFLIWSFSGFAVGPVEVQVLRKEIKERVENVLVSFDKSVKVDVKAKFSTTSKVNYKNPFILAAPKNNTDYKKLVRSVKLTIFSTLNEKEFPKLAIDQVKEVVKEYTRKSSIEFKTIPAHAQSSGFGGLSLFQVILFSMIFFITGVFAVFKFFDLKAMKKNSDELKGVIVENLGGLRTAFEGGMGFGPATSQNDFAQTSKPFNVEINAGGDTFLKDFSISSLEEIIMDCYWGHEDEYAAFLWAKLDIVRKGRLLAENARIGDYANYISELEGVDKKYINETYYFNPLALNEISNENLTNLVNKFNSVFHLLPRLRISSLGIDATEKKKLITKKFSKKDTEMELQSIKWDEYKTTEQRSFDSNLVFYFESLEEEEKFFNEPNLDFSLVKSFPSLNWLTFLREEDIQEILNPYNAKELALAWYAPEAALQKLENALSEKKVELLKSYLAQVKPSRKSEVYRQIINAAAEKLSARKEKAA